MFLFLTIIIIVFIFLGLFSTKIFPEFFTNSKKKSITSEIEEPTPTTKTNVDVVPEDIKMRWKKIVRDKFNDISDEEIEKSWNDAVNKLLK
jgi:hypothetical protein